MAPYGRGGAGNYEAIQRENEKVANDLEANQSAADNATNNYVPPDIAERSEAQYAHTGRGGAGNYYSPRELTEHVTSVEHRRATYVSESSSQASPKTSS